MTEHELKQMRVKFFIDSLHPAQLDRWLLLQQEEIREFMISDLNSQATRREKVAELLSPEAQTEDYRSDAYIDSVARRYGKGGG